MILCLLTNIALSTKNVERVVLGLTSLIQQQIYPAFAAIRRPTEMNSAQVGTVILSSALMLLVQLLLVEELLISTIYLWSQPKCCGVKISSYLMFGTIIIFFSDWMWRRSHICSSRTEWPRLNLQLSGLLCHWQLPASCWAWQLPFHLLRTEQLHNQIG